MAGKRILGKQKDKCICCKFKFIALDQLKFIKMPRSTNHIFWLNHCIELTVQLLCTDLTFVLLTNNNVICTLNVLRWLPFKYHLSLLSLT